MTFDEALQLGYGDTLYHGELRNADGSPQAWRVTGRVRTWKRQPGHFEIPIKRGLRQYGTLTEAELSQFYLTSDEARQYGEIRATMPALDVREQREQKQIDELRELLVFHLQSIRVGGGYGADRTAAGLILLGDRKWVLQVADRFNRRLQPFTGISRSEGSWLPPGSRPPPGINPL